MKQALLLSTLALLASCATEVRPIARTEAPGPVEGTVWGQVVLGGGGAVPGVALSPLARDTAYMRTDVGGCYRWDEAGRRWHGLLDHISPANWNHHGVASLALDPRDPHGLRIYAALGKYDEAWASPRKGIVVRSQDGGRTWEDSGLSVGISSNCDQSLGERLAFDPASEQAVWFASRSDGLFRTAGGTAAWHQVELPRAEGGGQLRLSGVLPTAGALWVATLDQGVLVSHNHGASFAPSVGAPRQVVRLVGDSDGGVWAAHREGLALFAEGTWHERAPAGAVGGFQAVAADPHDPRLVMAAPRGTAKGVHQLPLYRSRDRGQSWERTEAGRAPTRSWWPRWCWFSRVWWLGFDPHHPGRAWASDYYAVYRTDDAWAEQPVWTNLVDGHEEIVTVGGLYAPPGGPHILLSGAADVGGFAHRALDRAPERTVWDAGLFPFTLTGIDGAAGDPLLVAAVGREGHKGRGGGGFSRDGGATWTPFPTLPGNPPAAGGRIAVGVDGRHLAWHMQDGQGLFISADLGASWQAAEPAAELQGDPSKASIFTWDQSLAADRVRPGTFYLLHRHRLWRSVDGGRRFTPGAALTWAGRHGLATAPATPGEVWIACGKLGLWRSHDGGGTVAQVPGIASAELVALGAGWDGIPTVFALGRVGGTTGIWASADRGAHWQALGDRSQAFGNDPNTLAGDPRLPGRVFIGTNGSGILWAQLDPGRR